MSVTILRGNALALPLADASVDLVVTSPPYFGLRSYQDGGEHYAGQIGSEATPAEFVDALIAATREMVRVLKPSGSIWVNLGDKYVSTPPGNERSLANSAEHQRKGKESYDRNWRLPAGFKQKSLMGIPWRYALRCIDELGLILRAEVIWSKPNGLPESVTDRVRRSHETWFHFTVQPRYFSAVDQIREEHNGRLTSIPQPLHERGVSVVPGNTPHRKPGPDGWGTNPLGKLPGSVWTIPTQPLQVPAELGIDHFAAFPMEWPRRIIRGWSPAGVCVECGEGRRPVTERTAMVVKPSARRVEAIATGNAQRTSTSGTMIAPPMATITGYACACPEPTAPTTPGVVLDPFGGTGTTALVADALGSHGISVDMSADYCRLARWRTTDPGQRAAAAQVEKVEPVHPDQLDLFAEDGAA